MSSILDALSRREVQTGKAEVHHSRPWSKPIARSAQRRVSPLRLLCLGIVAGAVAAALAVLSAAPGAPLPWAPSLPPPLLAAVPPPMPTSALLEPTLAPPAAILASATADTVPAPLATDTPMSAVQPTPSDTPADDEEEHQWVREATVYYVDELPQPEPSAAVRAPAPAPPRFELTATIGGGMDNGVAIIDGEVRRVGDRVGDGYVLSEIGDGYVRCQGWHEPIRIFNR